ncbi:LLM class flavin-dependent oxidoreductase [Nocardia goodfellowii]|uniref:Alkanesulfonate monooxygenase SsuD/methylene tetrahydromethanopterin reductase-like flavin-dependent oxidoreductase (Luciferase family) n=1 Tax=Nocardia goodfellowii TaxID=882446 RepID=A0ABS4Q8N2_9NOCA|nr:LLM class flavin-dependent oxidoreductase [Nocardia goodfellowii]MBP2187505.1 alkanesulfonate monooxygenase SsuD/methylene tetrahydromethanopterin reductase-like flavin-dependent oxidoreductase (luciferase family) [Nocardia goodfellowii]
MAIQIGVFLPTSGPHIAESPAAMLRDSARAAEAAGLESVWATDHLVAAQPMLDSTVALTTAAAVTDRIRIGFGAMLLALRPTAWAAKEISTLQQLSNNRLLLGIGTGNPAHGDTGWRAANAPFEERGTRTDRALTVLPDLIAGKPATLSDDLEVTLSPGAPIPPILIAGNSTRARRRAAAHGDAWMPINPGLENLPALLTELRELAQRHERPTPAVTVVAPAVSTEPGVAAEELAAYEAAGVERVVLAPTGSDWRRDYAFAGEVRAAQ